MTVADQRPDLPQESDVEPGGYRCHECGAAITVTKKGVEAGHANGTNTRVERCSRRDSHYENKRGDLA